MADLGQAPRTLRRKMLMPFTGKHATFRGFA